MTKRTSNFRNAAEIQEADLRKPEAKELILKNTYVGVNASDINFSAGRYDMTLMPPHGCGFESIGIVEAAGDSCRIQPGQAVAFFGMPARAFSEYVVGTGSFMTLLVD